MKTHSYFSKIFLVGVLALFLIPSALIAEKKPDFIDPLTGDVYKTYPPEELLEGKNPNQTHDLLERWIGADSRLREGIERYFECKRNLAALEQKLSQAEIQKTDASESYLKVLIELKKLLAKAMMRLGLQTGLIIADATTDIQLGIKKAEEEISKGLTDINSARKKAEMIAEFERLSLKAKQLRELAIKKQLYIASLEKALQKALPPDPRKPVPDRIYVTKEMPEMFKQYDEALGIKYFTPGEKETFRVFTKDGKLVDGKGNLLDTSSAKSMHPGGGSGKGIYVMDKKGDIYVHTKPDFKTRHSSFTGGDSVAAAGEVEIRNGKLISIDPDSGHYRPDNPVYVKQVVERLQEMGIDTSEAVIKYDIP